MQRPIVTILLMTIAGAGPAFAQPMPPNGYYYQRQAVAAPPSYPQQQYAQPRYAQPPQVQPQYAQPQYAEPERPNLGGGFIEFVFSGGQSRHGRPVNQAQPGAPQHYVSGQQPYVPGQPMYGQPPHVRHASLPPQRLAMDPRYLKQVVDYHGSEPPGTVVVSTGDKFLYLVQEDGKAVRYGIGVGREGFTWRGTEQISAKREWPDWRPPKEMLERRPELPRYMEGGPDNPLGARALYLGSTLYRIHGSNEPWTIGTQVSSGCIRMRNEDVIDLYERVKLGTKVVVI
jgi:lipoprotein-anchoring transpeptidase ErfK/SrfK